MAEELIGESRNGRGVTGTSGEGDGVFGQSERGRGVVGLAVAAGVGVEGNSANGVGVFGQSDGVGRGVVGLSKIAAGVEGNSVNGVGVVGQSDGEGRGVVGLSKSQAGVEGNSGSGAGVVGVSTAHIGVFAVSERGSAAIRGEHRSGGFAGSFAGHVGVEGDLTVSGDVRLTGADLAEEFGVVGELAAEPGCVVVLAGDDCVRVSDSAYDTRVAGVVSGAGSYVPALVLDRRDDPKRRALALSGKVWCNVDATWGPVALGDMLTTSPTPGHAMRAGDPLRAAGTIIGKALGRLDEGRGLLPVLVALR